MSEGLCLAFPKSEALSSLPRLDSNQQPSG